MANTPDEKYDGKNIGPAIAGIALGTAAVVAGVALTKKKNRDKFMEVTHNAFEKGKELTHEALTNYQKLEHPITATKGGQGKVSILSRKRIRTKK